MEKHSVVYHFLYGMLCVSIKNFRTVIIFEKIDGKTQCYVSFLVRNAVFFHQILSDRHALTLQGMLLDPQGVL